MKRRDFVRNGAYAALVVPASRATGARRHGIRLAAASGDPARDPAAVTTLRDARVKALALAAVDAARSAGARYADVRLTNTVGRGVGSGSAAGQGTILGLSVRALVNGYWGWAETPVLSTDEAIRVARLATRFATVTATRGRPRTVDLGTIPVVQDGDWTTPVKIDPFDLDLVELHEWCFGMCAHLQDLADARHAPSSHAWDGWDGRGDTRQSGGVGFSKQECLFASTEGSLITQTVITTSPSFKVSYRGVTVILPGFTWTTVQAGWERIVETPMIELFQHAMDQVDAAPPPPPSKPLEIGRYDVVFSAFAVAQLLTQSLAPAMELDRMLGYEANASGTSYLGPDPLACLGTPIASPLVSIDADRSSSLGVATTKWDDDGVVPEDFPLLTNGILQNYPTTREQAAWLSPWYEKHGRPVRSLGCAMSPDARSEPMQHTPNLTLRPGVGSEDIHTLLRDLDHGLLIGATLPVIANIPNLQMDQQCLDGYAFPVVATEIRHGRPVSTTALGSGVASPPSGLMFRTDEFWKNIKAVGGSASAEIVSGGVSRKGDPQQVTSYTINSVPVRVKQLAIIDATRKA